MKPVALFLVKNGIGYGHIRRALVIAEELARHKTLSPIIVSQARTLDLFTTSTVPVLNLPLLHRVPSAVGEDAYLDILDRVVERLAPTVAIEDTYPDQRYDRLPSLNGVPRILVLRRLDGESFDTLRGNGAFAAYDRILLAQDGNDLAGEDHSGESLYALRHSHHLTEVGDIHCAPSRAEVDAVRRQHPGPLVVVNAGAGGDQLHDGYGHRLLEACHRTAEKLNAAGHRARFVVVTGPYYAGPALSPLPNLTVHRFTPTLPALLAAADVAVIKPGNNALGEVLHGHAHLVLVPDASFMEGTRDNAERVVERYGGVVVNADGVPAAIEATLTQPARRISRPASVADSLRAAVDAIHAATVQPVVASQREVAVLLRSQPGTPCPPWASAVMPLSALGGDGFAPVVIADAPPRRSPQDLVDGGVEILASAGAPSPAVLRWARRSPPSPALPVIETSVVAAGPHDQDERVLHRFARALDTDPPRAAVVLDIRRLTAPRAVDLLRTIEVWLADQTVHVVPVERLRTLTATRLLHGRTP